jgi:hypothetical protein
MYSDNGVCRWEPARNDVEILTWANWFRASPANQETQPKSVAFRTYGSLNCCILHGCCCGIRVVRMVFLF